MRRTALLLALAVVFTPLAAAEPGLIVDSIDMSGDLREEGGLLGLSLIGDDDAGGLEALNLSAASVVAYRYWTEGAYVAPGVCDPVEVEYACRGTSSQTSQRPEEERSPPSGAYHDINVRAAVVEPSFQVHVFPVGGADLDATMQAARQYRLDDACLGPLGIGPAAPGCSGFDAGRRQLSSVPLGDHAAVTNASAGAVVSIHGDFVMELRGVTVYVEQTGATWHSGDATGGSAAGTYERGILRIFVTDGLLQVAHGAGLLESEWVLAQGQTTAIGSTLVLHGARGHLALGDGRDLDGATEELVGDFLLTTAGTSDGLDLGVSKDPRATNAPDAGASGAMLGWTGAAGAVALVVAGAFLVLRQRDVSMARIERALEEGRYRRAARLSQRRLRHDPFQESAHLSRAIAWARGGRASRVVPAVHAYLQVHEPHDGALHYVLGMAYLDLGDEPAARDAMAEATKRTPALRDEIAVHIRPGAAGGDGYS